MSARHSIAHWAAKWGQKYAAEGGKKATQAAATAAVVREQAAQATRARAANAAAGAGGNGPIQGIVGGFVNDWAALRATAGSIRSQFGNGRSWREIGSGIFGDVKSFFTPGDTSARWRRGITAGVIGMGAAYTGLDLTRRAFTDPNTGRFNMPGVPFF